ncbi:hypothetical protein BC831DRAFT_552986, partial [Entophlyctis helioformis]
MPPEARGGGIQKAERRPSSCCSLIRSCSSPQSRLCSSPTACTPAHLHTYISSLCPLDNHHSTTTAATNTKATKIHVANMQLLLSATVALLATSASAQTVSTLRTERASGRLAFLPYTLAQRNALLTQAETVLNSAWVNRESKAINYGPAADPTPTLQRIRANLTTISDGELQLQLSDAFIQVRDLHTLFLTNGPYRCYGATTGLFFEFVEGADADIANNPASSLCLSTGDSFAEWFRKNQFTSGAGANAFGGQRRGIDYLSYDTITFTFKSRATGATYSAVINYVTSRNDACYSAQSA